ncbi:M13 family metallopeptidase [Psychroflexus lacisalsi]|jgi:putative endopeptidase|uniref:M13 family metallopeptidase n=1 Tax=Psychroflexus lacisalsi TaxID=503928 RepID=A0ABN1K268_9FLAO|nr:M13 family metallopeptidase [Psychroflexus lacisalsi]MBZ9621121.1 M13 family metallopeptidase [Psychroflexus lacisalsi]
MNKVKLMFVAIGASTLLFSCQDSNKETADESRGIALQYMDTTVNPQDDFYSYVNGGWMKTAEIPDDRTSWGGFQILRKSTDNDVLEILKTAEESGKYSATSDQGKAISVFNSIMDTLSRNVAGVDPIMDKLDLINEVKTKKDIQKLLAEYPTAISAPFFGVSSYSDPDDSNTNAAYVGTGSLGLPDRDYYLDQDDKSKEIREQYKEHIVKMLAYFGGSKEDAKFRAETILKLETQLAEPRLDKVARRDFRNFNNRYAVSDLNTVAKNIDLKAYMTDLGIEKLPDTVLVMEPKYMEALDQMIAETPLNDLKSLMTWSTINSASNQLSTEIATTNWEFYSKTLSGAKAQRPLDERALSVVNGSIGEAVGKLYVDQKFPPEAKEKAEDMVGNVITAFKNRINDLEWMEDKTKTKAIEKLDKFTVKIGYPDEFEDYSDLSVSPENTYYENMQAVSKWNYKDNLSKIGEPVDKTEWGMSPQTVNAYFNPLYNEIVFPAAILQPPFYDYKADAAVNYGGIGAVIGHEISHAFDDSGSRFDADGNLKNWWSDKDLEKFTERGNNLAELYSSIEVLDSVYINGKFTLGENIGDLGGVLGAYDGLMLHYENNEKPGKIAGFTPEQRFFMSWATVWRTKTRDEALRTQVKTDPHSPGQYRAYVPLQNIDAFYDAFDVKEGDDMFIAPEERVRIW